MDCTVQLLQDFGVIYFHVYIMNTVNEVKYTLSKQVPVEEDDVIIATNIQRNNTDVSDTISMSTCSNVFGGVSESTMSSLAKSESFSTNVSQSSPRESHEEVFLVDENKTLVYWSTGLVDELAFSIQSLAEITEYHDKDGILILASHRSEGCKILGQLINIDSS